MSEALKKRLARDVIAEEIAEYRKVARFSLHLGLAGAASSQYLTQSRSR